MTTTVTVKTHDWPAQVSTHEKYDQSVAVDGITQRTRRFVTTIETVPPHSERTIYITDSRDVLVTELPLPIADAEFTEVGTAA